MEMDNQEAAAGARLEEVWTLLGMDAFAWKPIKKSSRGEGDYL